MAPQKKDFVKLFQNPTCEYRGAPFWSLNGKLEGKEMCRQIRQFHQAGMGGYFLHSRVGLQTEFLGKEWFEAFHECKQLTRELKMQMCLYDEDRWPSGAAGGLVTKNPAYRARFLHKKVVREVKGYKPQEGSLALFTGKFDGFHASDVKRVKTVPARLKEGYSLVDFHVQLQAPDPWYNDQTYLDVLNPKAVREFIKTSYQKYYDELGKDFGKLIPSIFTDEPNFGGINLGKADEDRKTAWTDAIPELFRKRFGYDLIDHLPEIFFQVKEVKRSKALYDYMETITTLFVDNFMKQIGDWCTKHNILFTGHVLAEDTPLAQARLVGDCMRCYEHMGMPGMDLLTEYNDCFETCMQLASAAHQFGKRWRLSEAYGCTGWNFPFAGHKAVGDFECLLGVNFRCMHLAWYTAGGEAKRDYQAAISRQSPWFPYYRVVEDHFARMNLITSEGEEVRDILVIHPLETT